jgi:GrpB-like predicted nucleotidyltransferase (UPF0157 family)
MSALESGAAIASILAIGVPAVLVQLRRARQEESTRDRLIREARQLAEQGRAQDPVTLAAPSHDWLPGDVEDHLIRFLIDHPDVADGFARLRRAAKEQPEGEQ